MFGLHKVPRDIASFTIGSVSTIGLFQLFGYLPLFFGPEKRMWSREYWDEDALKLMDELSKSGSGFLLYRPKESDRNFLQTGPHPDSTSARRVRRVLYFNPFQKKIRGVVHFGADLEGMSLVEISI